MDQEFHDDYTSPECQGVRLVCKRCGVFRALSPEEVERVMMDMDDEIPFACERVKRSCFQADTPKQDPLIAAFQRLCQRCVRVCLEPRRRSCTHHPALTPSLCVVLRPAGPV